MADAWTGAYDELTRQLAHNEALRRQDFLDRITLDDRRRQWERQGQQDAMASRQAQLAEDREKRIEADNKATRERIEREAEAKRLERVREDLPKGPVATPFAEKLIENDLGSGVIEKRPGTNIQIGQAAQPAPTPEGLATLPTQRVLKITPDTYSSLGGPKVQAAEQAAEDKRNAAYAAAQAAMDKQAAADATDVRIAQIGAEGRAANAALMASMRGQMTPNQLFNNEMRLTGVWDRASAGLRTIKAQSAIMDSALADYKAGNRSGGGQAIVQTFNKILDPISVVRESEYMRSVVGQSLLDRAEAWADRIARGGPGLSDNELESLVTVSKHFAERYEAALDGLKRRTQDQAKRHGLADPTVNFDEPTQPSAATTTAPAGTVPGTKPKSKYEIVSVK